MRYPITGDAPAPEARKEVSPPWRRSGEAVSREGWVGNPKTSLAPAGRHADYTNDGNRSSCYSLRSKRETGIPRHQRVKFADVEGPCVNLLGHTISGIALGGRIRKIKLRGSFNHQSKITNQKLSSGCPVLPGFGRAGSRAQEEPIITLQQFGRQDSESAVVALIAQSRWLLKRHRPSSNGRYQSPIVSI